MTADQFKEIVLTFENTIATNHFDRIAFKVKGKRIFATLHEASNSANIKLSSINQSVFCCFDKDVVYPVPNKWGLQGWTTFEFGSLTTEFVSDALQTAYNEVFTKTTKLA